MNNFVKVEGGVFVRKHDLQIKKRLSIPEITVKVDTFYIDDFAVTQGDWNQAMPTNPSYFKDDNLPVECVSWYDAVLFCNKKSKKTALFPAILLSVNMLSVISPLTVIAYRQRPNGNLRQ